MVQALKKHLPQTCYSFKERPIEGVVIHYFSYINRDPSQWDNVDRCWELFKELHVSADYLISQPGKIYELVPPGRKSWHAGVSSLNGRDNCNDYMAGIELIAAPQYSTNRYGFSYPQYHRGAELVKSLMMKHGFGLNMVVGHDEVSPGRKQDPGESFDWSFFRYLIEHEAHGKINLA